MLLEKLAQIPMLAILEHEVPRPILPEAFVKADDVVMVDSL